MLNRRNNGFTLMEMLVVIAIIAVLVAIAIPVFSSQAESAKRTTDLANERSAYAAALAEWMSSGDTSSSQAYYFDGNSAVTEAAGIAGYGQSSDDASTFSDDLPATVYGVPNENGTPSFLKMLVRTDGSVLMSWGATSLIQGEDWWSYQSGTAAMTNKAIAYEFATAGDNNVRKQADLKTLESIANVFLDMTVDQAKSILGEQYEHIVNLKDSKGRILEYGVDGSRSVLLNRDEATVTADYLATIGYTPKLYNKNAGVNSTYTYGGSSANTYVNKYLLTSDAAVSGNHGIFLKLNVENDKVVGAKVYLGGLQNDGYTASVGNMS